ncbi:C6: Complement component C6 [Crotalus adamanteus]|uniref:C6: Complement component C6 n=1 Tax=Crotalus adamanteus TaxID=8729 RepID=A0AAW1C2D5_CROAD
MSSSLILIGVLCILGANGFASAGKARSIVKFGQFGGKPCTAALSDREPCETKTLCPDERGHCGNQEFECENGSVNMLGMKPAQKALYNEFYNGICDRVRDGNTATYYRKPWNVAVLNYDVTTKEVNECLGFNLDIGANIMFIEANTKVKREKCKNEKLENGSTDDKSGIIQDVVSLIQGGTTATLTKLNELLSSNVKAVDVEQYVEWAATLPQAPTVISQELSPISELIPLNIPDSRLKKENLNRAAEDYVAEYSVCKCWPCLHGGTAMLIEGKCECACTPFYKGEACEIPASTFIPDKCFLILIQLKQPFMGAGAAGLAGPPVSKDNAGEQENVIILSLDLGASHVLEQT